MATKRQVRLALAVAIVVALGVLVPPLINVKGYRGDVGRTISHAIGRDVTIDSVALQLLPQPGLRLKNFVVKEDPRFGAEPLLRSSEVAATLRLSSLWRGRLEIGSLSLKEPSLNLVRAADGHWNIEALLLRAVQTPAAPTAKPRPESRPRFPYIQADSGRINLKLGEEKKVWTLTDADFALWLASEDEWRTRLVARPVRTDATLSDTGRLRVTGSLQRQARLEETLVSFHVALEDAQLGQITTLIYGRDRGWRGATQATLDIAGTPAHLALAATTTVDQFRRYDITPPDSLRLQLRCASQYAPAERRLTAIECHLPAGDGELSLRGSVASLLDHPAYDLSWVARDVPMSFAVALARRAKRDLPGDLAAAGRLNAAVTCRTGEGGTNWAGGGATDNFLLSSGTMGAPLSLGSIAFVLEPDLPPPQPGKRVAAISPVPAATPWRLSVRPFNLALGADQPTTAQATFSQDGYVLQVSGPAALDRLLRLAHATGVPAPAQSARGAARLALQVAGQWQGFPQPTLTGTADLHNVRFELAGVAGPVQIASATLTLTPTQTQVQNLVAAVGGALAFSGSLRLPRGCTAAPCRAEFALRSERVSLDDLNRLFNPRLRSQSWYQILAGSGESGPSIFSRLHAAGTVEVARLALKNVTLQNASGSLRLDPGVVDLTDGSASLYGGTIRGDWHADFTGPDPAYNGTGSLERISLAQVSAAMRDNWATGAADATYRLVASGWTTAQLLDSAAGSLEFAWGDGQLRHLALTAARSPRLVRAPAPGTAAALRIRNFRGRATIRNGVFTIADSSMETTAGVYSVSGTASRSRQLDLTFNLKGAQEYAIGGTLEAPRVQAKVVSEPRAAVSQ